MDEIANSRYYAPASFPQIILGRGGNGPFLLPSDSRHTSTAMMHFHDAMKKHDFLAEFDYSSP